MASISELTNLSQTSMQPTLSGGSAMPQSNIGMVNPQQTMLVNEKGIDQLATDISKLVTGIEAYGQKKYDLSVDATKRMAIDHKISYIEQKNKILSNLDLSPEDRKSQLTGLVGKFQTLSAPHIADDDELKSVYDDSFTNYMRVDFSESMGKLDIEEYKTEMSKLKNGVKDVAAIGPMASIDDIETSAQTLVKNNEITYADAYTLNVKAIENNIDSEASMSEMQGIPFAQQFIKPNGVELDSEKVKAYVLNKFSQYIDVDDNGNINLKKSLKLDEYENQELKNTILGSMDKYLKDANNRIASMQKKRDTLNKAKNSAEIVYNTQDAKVAEDAMKNGTADGETITKGVEALKENVKIIQQIQPNDEAKIAKTKVAAIDFVNHANSYKNVYDSITENEDAYLDYKENGYTFKNDNGEILYTMNKEQVAKIGQNYLKQQYENAFIENPTVENAIRLKDKSERLGIVPQIYKETNEIFQPNSTKRFNNAKDMMAKLTLLRQYENSNPISKNSFLITNLERIAEQYGEDDSKFALEANKAISTYRTNLEYVKITTGNSEELVEEFNENWRLAENRINIPTMRTAQELGAREGRVFETTEDVLKYIEEKTISIADASTTIGRTLTPFMEKPSRVLTMPYVTKDLLTKKQYTFELSDREMSKFFNDKFFKQYNKEKITDIDFGEVKAYSEFDQSGNIVMKVNVEGEPDIRAFTFSGQDVYDIMQGKKDIFGNVKKGK